MKVNFFKFTPDAIIPTKGNEKDAGIDLYTKEAFHINPKGSISIGIGIGWEPEVVENRIVYAQVKARSGWAIKKGVEVSTAGVIDESFRGEWVIKLFNTTRKRIDVEKGAKIAQAIIFDLPKTEIEEIDVSLVGSTDRGSSGFGSSGY